MKKLFPFFASLVLLLSVSGLSSVQAQDNEADPYVIIVEFTFSEQNVDKAIELLLEMQTQTLENEEGCIVYDVLLSEEDETRIFLYESYESDAAYKKHTASTYYKSIVEKKMKPLVKTQKITKVVPLGKEEIGDADF